MGRPKLLLPLGTTTVIGRLLTTLSDARMEAFVLVRADDEELRREVSQFDATIVQPRESPAEMRDSVEYLLHHIDRAEHPASSDGWMLIPADHPLISPATLQRLVEVWQESPASIVLPTHKNRRGHPTLFPWTLTAGVFDLPAECGINQLLHAHPELVKPVEVDDPTIHVDMDTPADYERARQLLAE